MADIIAEAGLSSGSLYSHFDSKADLLRFVVSTVLDSRLEEWAVADATGEPFTPSRVLTEFIRAAELDRERAKLLLQVWAEIPRDAEMTAVAKENLGRIRESFQTRLAPWDARKAAGRGTENSATGGAADLVMAVLQGYVVRLALDPDLDPAALLDTITAALG